MLYHQTLLQLSTHNNMRYVQVKDNVHLVRDMETGAIINRDVNGLNEYQKRRLILQTQKEEINNMKDNISELKGDVSEIKNLLSQLLNKHG